MFYDPMLQIGRKKLHLSVLEKLIYEIHNSLVLGGAKETALNI